MRLTEAIGLAESAILAEDDAALAEEEARLKEYYQHVLDEKTVSFTNDCCIDNSELIRILLHCSWCQAALAAEAAAERASATAAWAEGAAAASSGRSAAVEALQKKTESLDQALSKNTQLAKEVLSVYLDCL